MDFRLMDRQSFSFLHAREQPMGEKPEDDSTERPMTPYLSHFCLLSFSLSAQNRVVSQPYHQLGGG